MKKAVIGGNIVEGVSLFDKLYKVTNTNMEDSLRNEVAVSMKNMLGNKKAVAVRVAAV